MRIF
ncbi:Protein of unknown function [Lactobacillus helveticus CIRM-BIA 101]